MEFMNNIDLTTYTEEELYWAIYQKEQTEKEDKR